MAAGQKTYKAAQDKLDAYVRDNGMRASKVRNIVLAQICQLPQPFTAEQLTKACQPERISVGTVYNSLNLFLLARILCAIKREHGNSFTEYELTTGTTVRMQIMCNRCGRVTEFHDKAIARLVQDRVYANFKMQRFSLFVYGECKLCRRLIAKKKKEE